MNKTEHHLFILWENARGKESEILQLINSEFDILKEIEIEWDKDKFFDNLTSFYGFEHHYRYFVDNTRGYGKFLVVVVACRLDLTTFSKIFDFVKNVWFPITRHFSTFFYCILVYFDFLLDYLLYSYSRHS